MFQYIVVKPKPLITFNLQQSWTKNNGRSEYPKQWQAFTRAFSDKYEAMRLIYDEAKNKKWCIMMQKC